MQETSNGFSFLACAGVLLQLRPGRSAHVINLLFLFWRVPASSCNDEMAAPHTSFSCFSFLACAAALLGWRRERSAHVIFLLFLFDVYCRSLAMAKWALRTRHFLAFPFWRVPPLSCTGEAAAPHTSKPCFFFLTCATVLLQRRPGFSAHVKILLFFFWRVPLPSCAGERAFPHTSQTCFFFFGVYCRRLVRAKWSLRTRHFTHFLKTLPINLSTTFVFIGLSSDSNVYMILSP